MIYHTETSVSDVSSLFGTFGIDVGFVTPTATGLEKSIMDATSPLREFLALKGVHHYNTQGQGDEFKKTVKIQFIQGLSATTEEMTLYRPKTKNGDPRIWIKGLKKIASPNDLIGLIESGGEVYVVNCTKENLKFLLEDSNSVLGGISSKNRKLSPEGQELLSMLKDVGSKGFFKSLRKGDTGVGFTLETMLGIKANSNKAPDYKGIEIKSARTLNQMKTSGHKPITLFSKTPNWKISDYSARKTLDTFGYMDPVTKRLQLFCSVKVGHINSLGFELRDDENDFLVNINHNRIRGGEDLFKWPLESLRGALTKKHRETFWIDAQTKTLSGIEHFHYVQVRHTRRPSIVTFGHLLGTGGICLDLTMSEKGKGSVRDHGYLFRIYGHCFKELLPEIGVYSLA